MPPIWNHKDYFTGLVWKKILNLVSVTGLQWCRVNFSAERCIHLLWPLRILSWFRSPFTPWFLPWRTLRWDPISQLLTFAYCRSRVISCVILVFYFLFLSLQNISSDILGFTGDDATRRNLKLLIKSLSRLLWRQIKGGNRRMVAYSRKLDVQKRYPLFIIAGRNRSVVAPFGSDFFGSRKAFNAVLHVAFFCLRRNVKTSFVDCFSFP